MQSPLRYPGGKSDFVSTVNQIIKAANYSGLPFCEPYAGSAAVSLGLLNDGTVSHATILERDPVLYSFWKCVFEKTDELVTRFEKLPITIATWHELQSLLKVKEPTDNNIVELGLAGLFLNRANFSGILKGGPIGGKGQLSNYKIDCRTNKDDIIKRIISISKLNKRVSVEYGDAISFIDKYKRRKKVFFYIDPPYFEKGSALYRYYYKHSDHKKLAECLKNVKFPWLLSYDSHHVIEFFYDDFFIRRHNFRYSARKPKNDEELLISNFELPADLYNWD